MVIEGCTLPMPGDHNVSNALAAVAVARHLGMKAAEIKAALASFKGVNRRFTKVGEVDGVTIIDDYGHHPVEIAAVLKAARQSVKPGARVIAVHQPHRYTRLSSLFEEFCGCFNDADVVGDRRGLCGGRGADPGRLEGRSGRRADPRTGTGTRAASGTRTTSNGWCASRRSRATWSSALARARSPPGPTRCPNGSSATRGR